MNQINADIRNKLTLPMIILDKLLNKQEVSERHIQMSINELKSIVDMLEPLPAA